MGPDLRFNLLVIIQYNIKTLVITSYSIHYTKLYDTLDSVEFMTKSEEGFYIILDNNQEVESQIRNNFV